MTENNANQGNIINVIDEFDYSTQNDSYNEKFRSWRTKKNNPYAFTFEKNRKESVYIDGRGFIEKSAADAEKKSLTAIFRIIGIAALMFVVFDNLISKLLIMLISLCGIDIHTYFSSSAIYGGSYEIAAVLIIFGLIKYFIPIVYLHTRFKLPSRIEFMNSMNNKAALPGAISLAFIICTATSLPAAYSTETKEVFEFFSASGADISVWNQTEFIIYAVFDVIIQPVFTQLLFCGAMFAVMRQFGDPFAIIMSSLTAALLAQDFRTMPAVFLITLAASYGMLSSGSVFTSVAVNIVYKMYSLALTIIEVDTGDSMPITRNLFMSTVLIAGGIGLIFYIRYAKKHNILLARYSSELTFGKRIAFSVKSFPYFSVAVLCVICAFIKAVL